MLTYALETFGDVEEELKTLIHDHWQEVTSRPDIPLDPQWEVYRALSDQGRLPVVTARSEGVLVGYIIHIIHNPLHYRTLKMAMDDAHFLKKEHRRGREAVRMFKVAEECLKALGVQVVSYHSKTRPDLERKSLFERMGYHLHEFIFTKQL